MDVRMPEPDAKAFSCSCGRYGPGTSWGVATHRSKSKCGGHVVITIPEDGDQGGRPGGEPGIGSAPPATATASTPSAPQPTPPEGDAVVVAGIPAPGKLMEPKAGAAPTTFRAQTESTAELRAYYDYFRAVLKYAGDFGLWQEEMTRLCIRELFGMELVMRVREQQQALAS